MRKVFGEHDINSMLYQRVRADREKKNLLDGVDMTEVRARQKTPKKFRGFLLDLFG